MNSSAVAPSALTVTPPAGANRRLAPWLCLLLLAIAYLVLNTRILLATVRDPESAQKMQAKDSQQYVEIARDFAHGDFSMEYVRNMPHRQPLYPLLLAPAERGWGDDLIKLGYVNVLVGLVLLVGLYLGLWQLFGSVTSAALVGLAFIANPFMVDKISCRLMTEPVHALCLVPLIFCYLAYVRHGRPRYFLGAAAAAGFDYLSRPNGLFIMGAMVFTFLCHDLWLLYRKIRTAKSGLAHWLGSRFLGYLGAGLVFLAVAAPSWVPRYRFFGHLFYHGYLSNFMWVDTYEEAHTGQAEASFTVHDYLQNHSLHDAFQRLGEGLWRVYLDIPRHTEHIQSFGGTASHLPHLLYFLAVVGLVFAVIKRRWEYCLLALFLFIQLLPVVWTIVANSGPRVSYGSFFPFELFFAALALSYLLPMVSGWVTSRLHRPKPAAGAPVSE